MRDLLAGRRVAITGASGMIGSAVAQHLSDLGATLVLIARDPTRLDALRSNLRGGPHETLALDVRDAAAWTRWQDRLSSGGEVHGLVTAAAILGPIGPIGSYPSEAFRDALDVNVTGTLLAIRHCLEGLTATEGSVVTFSGGGATGPLPRFTAYAASKAAVVRMTENLALELDGRKIRINAVAPGFVVGDIHNATIRAGPELAGPEYYARTVSMIESGGDKPDRAAELTAFLLSDAAHDITGKLLSAIWDPWEDEEFRRRLRTESDLATLRRIDDQQFRTR